MCGRFSLALESAKIEQRFHATFTEPFKPRYNAAPSQRLPVILNADPKSIVLSPWGIKPPWLVKRDGLINVRAETLREKRTFQKDLADRRCLVPADGFYEWKVAPGGKKVPIRIVRRDGGLFAFAGIWEVEKDGAAEPRFAIITTRANDLMRPIHLRMPVILTPDQERLWLSGNTPVSELLELLEPAPSEDLRAYEISPMVNRATTDTPAVMEPV